MSKLLIYLYEIRILDDTNLNRNYTYTIENRYWTNCVYHFQFNFHIIIKKANRIG